MGFTTASPQAAVQDAIDQVHIKAVLAGPVGDGLALAVETASNRVKSERIWLQGSRVDQVLYQTLKPGWWG